MSRDDAWGTGWMIVSTVLFAVLIISLVLEPGQSLNWTGGRQHIK